MASATLTCPECGTALRGAEKVPAGKKVKCRNCSAMFVMPEQKKIDSPAAIRDKPSPSRPARPIRDDREEPNDDAPRSKRDFRDDAEDETPRRRCDRNRDEVEDEPPRRRKPSAAEGDFDVVDDEDVVREEYTGDDEVVEDRPPKKRRKKKKAVRRGGKGLLVGAVAGSLLLLLGGSFLVYYFVALRGTNWGGSDDDPLAYVPPDSNFIVGMDIAALADDNAFGRDFRNIVLGQAEGQGGGFLDFLQKRKPLDPADIERVVFGVKLKSPGGGNIEQGMGIGAGPPGGFAMDDIFPPTTVIVKYRKSFNPNHEAQTLANAKQVQEHGKYYYQVPTPWMDIVYMPSNRTVISTSLHGPSLEPVLLSDGKRLVISSDAAAAIRSIQNNTFWGCIPLDGKLRKDWEADLAKDPPPAPFRPLVNAVLRSRAVTFWGNLEGNRLNLGLVLNCTDANAASQLTSEVQGTWNNAKGGMALVDRTLGETPKMKQLVNEIATSLQFSAQGSSAQITASVNRQSLTGLASEAMGIPMQAARRGGFNPGGKGRR